MVIRVGGNLAISIRLSVKHRAYDDQVASIATQCIFMVYFLFPEFFFLAGNDRSDVPFIVNAAFFLFDYEAL